MVDPMDAAAAARDASEHLQQLEAKGWTPAKIQEFVETAQRAEEAMERAGLTPERLEDIAALQDAQHRPAPVVVADESDVEKLAATVDRLAARVEALEARHTD